MDMNNSLDFALRALPAGTPFLLANAARPADAYLFAQLLPERTEYTYSVNLATMTIKATMAGLVGMDSPYPPGGSVEASVFNESTAKIANLVRLPEATLRKLQEIVMRLQLTNTPITSFLTDTILQFTDKLIVQAHIDTMEMLRGQALVNGALNWTFNGKTLAVDYGVPSDHIIVNRTGNDAYAGSTSQFWTDIYLLRKALKYNIRAFIAHPDTIQAIIGNPVNHIAVNQSLNTANLAQQNTFSIQRLVGANERPSADQRDSLTLIAYGLEAEAIDPTNPGGTRTIPFMPRGKLLAVGNNTGTRFDVGTGSTPPVENALGYTHIAPTTEGNGVPGRYANVYRPEREQWALEGVGVTNGLPVLEAPYKVAVASTDMS